MQMIFLTAQCWMYKGACVDKAIDNTYIKRQVLPQAPSPTITSFRLSSAGCPTILIDVYENNY